VAVTVLSPEDGPLRARFAEFARAIRLVDAGRSSPPPMPARPARRWDAVARAVDFPACDLVVCNTFTTFWAVHAAKAAGRRVLLYVPREHHSGQFLRRPGLRRRGRPRRAGLLASPTASPSPPPPRGGITAIMADPKTTGSPRAGSRSPGSTPGARQHPRSDLRARFHLRPGELLVTNVARSATARASTFRPCRGSALAAPPGPRGPQLALSCSAAATHLRCRAGRPPLPSRPPQSRGPSRLGDYLPYYARRRPLRVLHLRGILPARHPRGPWSVRFPCSAPACRGVPEQRATVWRPRSFRRRHRRPLRRHGAPPPVARHRPATSPPAPAPAWSRVRRRPAPAPHAALAAEIARRAPGP
jgi:hypothetical protein